MLRSETAGFYTANIHVLQASWTQIKYLGENKVVTFSFKVYLLGRKFFQIVLLKEPGPCKFIIYLPRFCAQFSYAVLKIHPYCLVWNYEMNWRQRNGFIVSDCSESRGYSKFEVTQISLKSFCPPLARKDCDPDLKLKAFQRATVSSILGEKILWQSWMSSGGKVLYTSPT